MTDKIEDPTIVIHDQDILHTHDTLVAHCCNTRNTMGSGVAKALRTRFPEIYAEDTAAYIKLGKSLLGKCIIAEVKTDVADTSIKYVANLYGQPNYGYNGHRHLDYEAMYQSLEALRNYTRPMGITSISMPFKLGSDRAGGAWPVVLEMIKHNFKGTGIVINLYRIK